MKCHGGDCLVGMFSSMGNACSVVTEQGTKFKCFLLSCDPEFSDRERFHLWLKLALLIKQHSNDIRCRGKKKSKEKSEIRGLLALYLGSRVARNKSGNDTSRLRYTMFYGST